MRVKEWCLGGQARHYRQTILLSSFVSAELNALFSRTCVNHAGKARLKPVQKVGCLCGAHRFLKISLSVAGSS